MKLSVSAFRGAQTSTRNKLFSSTKAVPYGTNTTSTFVVPTSMAHLSPFPAADNQMMVDNTGVGPGGGSDPSMSAADATGTNTSASANQPNASPSTNAQQSGAVGAKSSKSDDHRISEKNQRSRSNQRWMKLRTTVQLSSAISSTIQKPKPQLKREDSFLKRFSTRQIPETQETLDTGDDGDGSSSQGEPESLRKLRRRKRRHRKKQPSTVVNPDENFYFYWLFLVTVSVLYNLWTLIVRQSFPEFQQMVETFWIWCDNLTDLVFLLDIVVQFRTGYLEQGLVVYDSKKLALHYVRSRPFVLDLISLLPLQLMQLRFGTYPILRFPRFLKVYRVYNYYYMVESRTVYPNFWRVANLIHILLILAHWFGCFYYLLSEAEKFKGDWVFPNNTAGYDTLTRKYLGSLYWSTLTLTTIGDLPTPETDAEFIFTIVSYLIGVFIFATIVGQVGNVITNRNANRLEFERLLDGAKTYMRHHKVPNGMKRRVLRWYDYSWSRGRIQGGGDINTALGLLPDKLKTELALHVNLSVLKKVTIFQECQPEFLHDLVLKMKAFIFTPGDLICRKGEVAREMFIIADGILEVISDTGHVLTTMMAGDFFGEIGILNLDGLNKRTADVRSVGYSELFSLSREDVLTAMKDYPEAQDILQSLGRKRLMEARSITKAITEQKNQAKLNAMIKNAAQIADHRSKNKIVERIYSDVKGLKSVLRRSRHGTKSEDSLELEPLTNISGKTENQFLTGNKGMLCRMQKVKSDDHYQDDDSPQPTERRISAGFPLLNKLKTLTDKHQQQQQQHQQQQPLQHQQYYHPHHHQQQQINVSPVDSSVGPSEMPKQNSELEPLGAGLPLIQRLLLLKQKEDAERKATTTLQSPPGMIAGINAVPSAKKPRNVKKEVVFAEDLVKKGPEEKAGGGGSSISGACKREFTKPWCLLRKATIGQGQGCATFKCAKSESSRSNAGVALLGLRKLAKDPTVSLRDFKCANRTTASDAGAANTHRSLSRLYGSSIKNTAQYLSSAASGNTTNHSNGGDITVINVGTRDGGVDTNDMCKEIRLSNNVNDRNNNNSNYSDSNGRVGNVADGNREGGSGGSGETKDGSDNEGGDADDDDDDDDNGMVTMGRRNRSGGDEWMQARGSRLSLPLERRRLYHRCHPSLRYKNYHSIEDLSPEYSSLPFVKRLKILNERQKLAQLEEKVCARSSSLDSCKETATQTRLQGGATSGTATSTTAAFNLTRSLSEATTVEALFGGCSRHHHQMMLGYPPGISTQLELASPESCETLERRKLKSILRRISAGKCRFRDILRRSLVKGGETGTGSSSDSELVRRLMSAPTVEGYVARRSTFGKSIACETTLCTPPPTSPTSTKTTFFGGGGGDVGMAAAVSQSGAEGCVGQYSGYSCSPPSKNSHLISTTVDVGQKEDILSPIFDHSSCGAGNGNSDSSDDVDNFEFQEELSLEEMRHVYKCRVKQIEYEVRKRDKLIRVLRTRIQELRKHHEHCYLEDTCSDDNTDCDTEPEQPFMRDDSVDTVLLSPPRRSSSSSSTNRKYRDHIEERVRSHRLQPKISLQYRRSWEDRSEEEQLELCELPNSIIPHPVWKSDVRIDIDTETDDTTSASPSETDELFGQSDDELLLARHDQNWEVRMLAQELEKRRHRETLASRTMVVRGGCSSSSNSSSVHGMPGRSQLLQNVRSLEEQYSTVSLPLPSSYCSQRSASSGNIHDPAAMPDDARFGSSPPHNLPPQPRPSPQLQRPQLQSPPAVQDPASHLIAQMVSAAPDRLTEPPGSTSASVASGDYLPQPPPPPPTSPSATSNS